MRQFVLAPLANRYAVSRLEVTVWRGRRFGRLGEWYWILPCVLLLPSALMTVRHYSSQSTAPNLWLFLAFLAFVSSVIAIGVRIWAEPSRPKIGRRLPTEPESAKLSGLGRIVVTDEPSLNPRREGNCVILHQDLVYALNASELASIVHWLNQFPLTIAVLWKVFSVPIAPLTTLVMFQSIGLGWKFAIVFVAFLLAIFNFFASDLLTHRLLTYESNLSQARRTPLASALMKIFELLEQDHDWLTEKRILNFEGNLPEGSWTTKSSPTLEGKTD